MKAFVFSALWILALCHVSIASEHAEPSPIADEVAAFFDGYLAVYNRRFGHPERSAEFRQEIGEQVHFPLLLAPVAGEPRAPASKDTFAAGFEAFVTRLEGEGVSRLEWRHQELQVLTPTKVLANNVGVGLTDEGHVAYETVSLYLLHRTEAGWRIVLFSPYDRERRISIVGE